MASTTKRIASLAVSRYGADRARVRKEIEALRQTRGSAADFLTALVVKGLLTARQAEDLRDNLRAVRQVRTEATSPKLASEDRPPTQTRRPDATVSEGGEAVAAEAPAEHARRIGRLLGGYRILRLLGEGGMGAVYLGYHEGLRRQVAIKVLSDELAANPVCVGCFYRESKSSVLLDHPNIVRGLTAAQDESAGCHYLVREFVDGPSGYALLHRNGRLQVGDAVRIALDIARALEYLHGRNYVHRDIKPDNILLDRTGAAKLADLGLVKRIGEMTALTAIHQGFGTSHYMPYEQAANGRSVDGRSDIYALGATLYHLLTGQVPFAGDTHLEIIGKKDLGLFVPAGSLVPTLPKPIDRILARMMARRPCDRYQTAGELITDLEGLRLASAIPSYASPEAATQALTGRSPSDSNLPTCLDLQARPGPGLKTPGTASVWYVQFRDESGKLCKTKASTRQLIRRLQDGRITYNAKASLQPRGQYLPLTAYPLFRGAAGLSYLGTQPTASTIPTRHAPTPVEAASVSAASVRLWYFWLKAGLVAGLLAILVTALVFVVFD